MPNSAATERAGSAIALVGPLTERLWALIEPLSDTALRQPCALPDWSRAHLVTHLARNADAMLNLLTWARTGVEHQAYTSNTDRDADIEAGAHRGAAILREDFQAAARRLAEALAAFPDNGWDAEITNRQGQPIPAHQIPWMRVTELTVHGVDLDLGLGFPDAVGALGSAAALEVLGGVVATFDGREVPACRIAVTLPDETSTTVSLGSGEPVELAGSMATVLAWLTGRADGAELTGPVPDLPNWR